MSRIPLGDGRFVPLSEVDFATTRSGGPGGQNVNKVETRVVVRFRLDESVTLSEAEKERVRLNLRTRVDRRGGLRVSSQKHRTQALNRSAAVERLGELLRQALEEKKPRRPTRPTSSARRARRKQKETRASIKRDRQGSRSSAIDAE